jgi:hypothetical protein
MARELSQETIAQSASSNWEGSTVLEWRPRYIAVVLVLLLIGALSGILIEPGPFNWEW